MPVQMQGLGNCAVVKCLPGKTILDHRIALLPFKRLKGAFNQVESLCLSSKPVFS